MKQVLVILRGAPSSGKSTIAKSLRDYEKKIAWLKIDHFKPFFAESSDSILGDVNNTAIIVLYYLLNQKFSIVMEGVFQNPIYIQEAVNIAKQKNIKTVVYELKCSINVLQVRDRIRPGVKEGCRRPLGNFVISNLSNIIEKNPFEDAIKLDTEKTSVDECIKLIKKNFD
ncbi:MAG: zeta toxin family protein [Candidatus Roizmanbacteria bacterium]|nr:zeta toxin family protein [Candidatus Roizmanbacteria bacterium]